LASLGPEYEPTLAGLDASGSTAYNDVVAKLKKAEARLKTGLQGLHSQNLARLTSAGNQDTFDRKISTEGEGINHGTRKGRCFHCGNTDHFIKECTEFINIIRKQVIDEMKSDGQHSEKGHTAAAMTVRRSKGSSGSLRAWGVSQKAPVTVW
jgi:Zinc knuckle